MTAAPRALLPAILLAILLATLATPVAALDFGLTGGVDFKGEFSGDAIQNVDVDADADTGYTLGLELTQGIGPVLELGVGGEYLFARGFEIEAIESEAEFVTLFALGRLKVLGDRSPLYVVGRLGYSDLSLDEIGDAPLDESGGLHWGAGVGLALLDTLKLEALWLNFDADVETDLEQSSFDYETVGLRLVLSF